MDITEEQLAELIDEPYLSRGIDYYENGAVQLLEVKAQQVKARVAGSGIYRVKLTLDEEMLDGTCSCPAFDEHGPCKHMAAVGFAVIEGDTGHPTSPNNQERLALAVRIEKKLMNTNKEALVTMLLDVIDDDPEIITWLGLDDEEEF